MPKAKKAEFTGTGACCVNSMTSDGHDFSEPLGFLCCDMMVVTDAHRVVGRTESEAEQAPNKLYLDPGPSLP